MNHLKRLEVSMTAGSSSTLRFYRKSENTRKKGAMNCVLPFYEERRKRGNAMMLTSGLLRVTDEHKYQRCGVVVMLVDLCYDNCAASTLTCFRGF